MRTEFMGTYRGCTQGLGANPEDFPTEGADLLSGKMRKALRSFRSRLQERRIGRGATIMHNPAMRFNPAIAATVSRMSRRR